MATFEVLEHVGAEYGVKGAVGEGEVVAVEVDDDVGVLSNVNTDIAPGIGDERSQRRCIAADVEDRAGEDGGVLVGDVSRLCGSVGVADTGVETQRRRSRGHGE